MCGFFGSYLGLRFGSDLLAIADGCWESTADMMGGSRSGVEGNADRGVKAMPRAQRMSAATRLLCSRWSSVCGRPECEEKMRWEVVSGEWVRKRIRNSRAIIRVSHERREEPGMNNAVNNLVAWGSARRYRA
jgi:hypothetical protein